MKDTAVTWWNSNAGRASLRPVIALERPWRQRTTGLRTNGLVATGSAVFVIMRIDRPAGRAARNPPLTLGRFHRTASEELVGDS